MNALFGSFLRQVSLTAQISRHRVEESGAIVHPELTGAPVALPYAVFGRRHTGEPSQQLTRY